MGIDVVVAVHALGPVRNLAPGLVIVVVLGIVMVAQVDAIILLVLICNLIGIDLYYFLSFPVVVNHPVVSPLVIYGYTSSCFCGNTRMPTQM